MEAAAIDNGYALRVQRDLHTWNPFDSMTGGERVEKKINYFSHSKIIHKIFISQGAQVIKEKKKKKI